MLAAGAGHQNRAGRMAVMLVHPWDAPSHDDEWRAVLHEFDFGQLIAPGGPDRDLPIVVPTHFIFDGERTLELHPARHNPVWRALAERPRTLGERAPYRVVSRGMQLQGALTVEDEVRRDDNRQVSVRSSWRDELSEVELVQHRPPLVVMAWGVPRVHQHDRHPASPI